MEANADDRFRVIERAKTARGIRAGYLGTALLYAALYLAWPAAPEMSRVDRFLWAVELSAFPALVVLAMFAACLRMPDTPAAVNPLLGEESLRWKISQRTLTNTVEQMAIFLPLLFALSLRIDPAHAKVIPLHVGLWVAARIAFAAGYLRSPALRAPGMAATSAVVCATLGWLLRSLVVG